MVTVVAAIDNVVKIVEQMLDRLDEPQHAGEKGEKAEIRILVHQSHAGALIGRSGSKIKELRDKCNIRLKVIGKRYQYGIIARCQNVAWQKDSILKWYRRKGFGAITKMMIA